MSQRRSKYGAKPTTINNIRFDSLAEGRRYQELLILASVGAITDLQVHPRYVIWEGVDPQKGKLEKIKYEPDFTYIENGVNVAEDVKGGVATQTPIFKMKAKMFRAKYPDIELRLIER
jgi:hypothetical protein